MLKDDCIMNVDGKLCSGLKELYCAKEDKPCPFYKSNKEYTRGRDNGIVRRKRQTTR